VSERRRAPVRPIVAVVLLVLGLVEIQGVAQTVRAQTRLRTRVIAALQRPVVATWSETSAALRPGGAAGWAAALRFLRPRSAASELEVMDLDSGRVLASEPQPSPVVHWLPPERRAGLIAGEVMTFGPVAGPEPRMLTYAAFPSGPGVVVLRLSSPAPELVDDLKERRGLLVAHAFVLVLLTIASALILLPERVGPARATEGLPYEEAMDRMRRQGEAQSHRHQEEVRDLEAMARAGELTAGMVHEVRNGLGTILGYSRLLEQGGDVEAVHDAALGIRGECETLELIVRRFVDFVRRETLRVEQFDAVRMLHRVIAREQARRSGAEVELRGEGVPLAADEELLERAFENLVRNAREAAGERGHVTVEATSAGDRVVVVIADDGPGFPPGADVLRPFVSLRAGGLGLGLPTASKIVRLHGGSLRLGARAPRGARVEVDLPRTPPGPSATEGDAVTGLPTDGVHPDKPS
jgi:signal transduction histidine kinase